MSKLTESVAKYCKKTSGQDMPIKALDKQRLGKLPLVITGSYHCYEAVLMGIPIILLEVLDGGYTPKQLQKHQQMVMRLLQSHMVFALENVASYHVSRMVDAGVNFIIPNKQMYVPTLLINLREVKDTRKLDDEVMPGIAQCLLLFHLQRSSLNGMTTKELAEKFNVSYASMNRAVRWMNVKGLVELEGVKEKTLKMVDRGRGLWEKALPLMLSPVERMLYTDEQLNKQPFAGESALESYTMLATPAVPCKAVSKEWASEQPKEKLNKYGECLVEVWRYDPMLLAKENVVDPLSLYLSMKSNEDERVRIELKNLINNVRWLED